MALEKALKQALFMAFKDDDDGNRLALSTSITLCLSKKGHILSLQQSFSAESAVAANSGPEARSFSAALFSLTDIPQIGTSRRR